MTFLILIATIVVAALLWKVTSFLPDLTYQLREIQSDLSAIRDSLDSDSND